MLVGAAGSGKSTFAARHFAPSEVLSSDALRALLAGDEANQTVSRAAFAMLFRELERRLAAGLLTVVDATNAASAHRASLLRRSAAAGVPAVAVVLALPAAIVLARNASRPRRVDEEVVRRQLDGVAAALRRGGLEVEGFAAIVVLRSPEDVARVTFRRVPSS
jgi:predicted kinase